MIGLNIADAGPATRSLESPRVFHFHLDRAGPRKHVERWGGY
ncbi:MAG: hypothetical protein ACI9QC_000063 [Oceanicoccus sp.]|jgi:hypothetical protein